MKNKNKMNTEEKNILTNKIRLVFSDPFLGDILANIVYHNETSGKYVYYQHHMVKTYEEAFGEYAKYYIQIALDVLESFNIIEINVKTIMYNGKYSSIKTIGYTEKWLNELLNNPYFVNNVEQNYFIHKNKRDRLVELSEKRKEILK